MSDFDHPYLYLTTTGWRSGDPHEIEIWFVHHEGCFYLVSEKYNRSHWVQNIRRNPAVKFRVGEHNFEGTGRIVENGAEQALSEVVSALMDTKYDWSSGLIVELCPAPIT